MGNEIIDKDTKNRVENIAADSLEFLEPICIDCWENGEHDPMVSAGTNRIKKNINEIVDNLIEKNEEADEMWYQDIKDDVLSIFYKKRKELFQKSNQRVENSLECQYCFENRCRSENYLSIRVVESSEMFERDDWR